jgi:hypothetical protein
MFTFNFNVHHHTDADTKSRLDSIYTEVLEMADNFATLTASVDAMEATVNSTADVLVEVKAALDAAITAGSLEQLKDVSARIDTIAAKLRGAAAGADITPETPVV